MFLCDIASNRVIFNYAEQHYMVEVIPYCGPAVFRWIGKWKELDLDEVPNPVLDVWAELCKKKDK